MPHKHFDLQTKIQWQRKIIRHDKWVIKTRLLHTQASVSFARKQLLWTKSELRSSLAQLGSSARQYGLVSTGSFPPHRQLWECISKYEGGVHSVNSNGHYGMLQMHAGWGYGTSYHASDDSQQVQEWAAERAFASSNYNKSYGGFLWQQWFYYDAAEGECLQYA